MENYALIARQEKQIEALKTENDYLKRVKTPTQIENANLRQRNDALELENNSLQSEIQVMNEKHNLRDWESGAEYALIARQEEQIEALKAESDYLKKVKTPTQIENANLRQRNDALELENNSLQSEIQVMNEKHETVKLDVQSAKLQNMKLTQQHNTDKKNFLFIMACVFVVVVLLVSVVAYSFGHRNALYDAFNYSQFQLGQVMNYCTATGNLDHSVVPTLI